MSNLQEIQAQYGTIAAMDLSLNMQRGQPSDADFDLSNAMLTIVSEDTLVTPSGIDIRNYPGGVAGLPEARRLFAGVLNVRPEAVVVGNNASLSMMSNLLMWSLLRGLNGSPRPWGNATPKMIVTVPGYDRHFHLLAELGFAIETVAITPEGPDIEAVERLAATDPDVKGIFFVPTYSNPTGDSLSAHVGQRLAAMKTAAPDFTIFADDAYRVHHLVEAPAAPFDLLNACEAAGNPNRVYVFGSTSKITFASGGLGYLASSIENIAYVTNLMGAQSIGPNKVEQYRHVRFLEMYQGGLAGLMADHARLIRPKFAAVQDTLSRELADTGLARWTNPEGGYFVSLDTMLPVADRVVALARGAGVALTPAGATYPFQHDPNNSNIRLSPTRPPVAEVVQAMEIVAVCIKLASAEYRASS